MPPYFPHSATTPCAACASASAHRAACCCWLLHCETAGDVQPPRRQLGPWVTIPDGWQWHWMHCACKKRGRRGEGGGRRGRGEGAGRTAVHSSGRRGEGMRVKQRDVLVETERLCVHGAGHIV